MDEAARQKIQTTPLGVLEIIEYAFRYFWAEMLLAGLFCSAVHFPVYLFGALINFQNKFSHIDKTMPLRQIIIYLGAVLIYVGVLILLGIIVMPFVTLWTANVVRKKFETGKASHVDAAQEAVVLWPSEIWTLFLKGVIICSPYILVVPLIILAVLLHSPTVIVASLIFILPGIIWMIYWSINYIFSSYIVAEASLWGKAALDYSKSLIKGQWWYTLAVIIVISFLFFIVEMVLCIIPLIILLVCAFIFPKNQFPQALYNTFIQSFMPLICFPLAVWYTNLAFLRKRTITVMANAGPPG